MVTKLVKGHGDMRSTLRPVGVLLASATLAGLLTASACGGQASAPGPAAAGAESGAGGQAPCAPAIPCGEREARCVGDSQIQQMHDVSCSDLCASGLCSGDSCGPDGEAKDCPSGTSCRDKRVSVTGYTAVCDDGQGGNSGDFEPCGNGVVDSGEACDDENRQPGDGCSPDCLVEPGFVCELEQPCRAIVVDGACQDACFDQDACVERASGVTCECPERLPAGCTDISFRSLLHLEGYTACSASAVSGDGTTVTGSCSRLDQNFQERVSAAVVWALGSGVSAVGAEADGVVLQDVNADGSVLVGSDGQGRALLIRDGKRKILAEDGAARSTSADGTVVVGYTANQAFLWKPDSELTLLQGPEGETQSYALGVSSDGSLIVGTVSTIDGSRAVLWDADLQAALLPVPDDATASEAVALSDDGSVLVGTVWVGDKAQAIAWTDAGFEILKGPTPSNARGVNATGTRIVGVAGDAPGVWDGGAEFVSLRDRLTDVSLDDWVLREVSDTSSDGGVLVGSAELTGASGSQEPRAFVAFVP